MRESLFITVLVLRRSYRAIWHAQSTYGKYIENFISFPNDLYVCTANIHPSSRCIFNSFVHRTHLNGECSDVLRSKWSGFAITWIKIFGANRWKYFMVHSYPMIIDYQLWPLAIEKLCRYGLWFWGLDLSISRCFENELRFHEIWTINYWRLV